MKYFQVIKGVSDYNQILYGDDYIDPNLLDDERLSYKLHDELRNKLSRYKYGCLYAQLYNPLQVIIKDTLFFKYHYHL